MKKKLLKHLWLLLLCTSSSLFAQIHSPEPLKGVLRVKLQPEVALQIGTKKLPMSKGIVATGIEPMDNAGKKIKAISMERVFPYVEKMETKARKHGLHLWYEIQFNEDINPVEAANLYKKLPGVVISENIVPMLPIEGNKGFIKVSNEQKVAYNTRAMNMPFNDPMLNQQWHYQNDGTIGSAVAGSDINLFNAWQVATGNRELLVAIIDGGIDYKHTDLAENMYVNEKELNGVDGVDDDQNGFIDDIYGYNFVTNSGDVYPHDHGTHVAGTVAAVNNNGIGVAGVAGGNGQGGIKMLSVQIFDSRGNNRGADYAKAIYYASVQGASIAQCSWGWGEPDYYEQSVLDAIKFYTQETETPFMKGGLCIFSNGNTGLEANYYPACMPEVVAVASMSPELKPANYSSYGTWTDVVAPGGETDFNIKHGVLSTLPNDTYGFYQGTSMACPHVSGIAALILSKYGSPTFANESLRLQLITSVNDFYTNNPTVIGKFGSGYIDATKAMYMGNGTPPHAVDSYNLIPGQDNITLEWKIPQSENDNSIIYHMVYYSKDPFVASSDLSKLSQKRIDTKFFITGQEVTYELEGLLPTTKYYLALQAIDRWGNSSELSAIESATTNRGPKMELNKNMLMLNLDASISSTTTENFIIKNSDEGLLKWESLFKTISSYPSTYTKHLPIPGAIKSQPQTIAAVSHSKYSIITSDYVKEDYPKEINYTDHIELYVGETNLDLPNSMAQWFYVDPTIYPDGFNLTDIFYLGGNGKEPRIEIYDGATTINKAQFITEVVYDFFGYSWDIPLKEQLFFEPGKSFWIVTHFSSGQLNPLASGNVFKDEQNIYSYYSSDLGKTWSLLSEVLKGSEFDDIAGQQGWTVVAKSKNPDWSQVMLLNPNKGSVKPNEEQTITISNDSQKLIDGNYTFNLTLKTNESEGSETKMPIYLNVNGNNPELKSAQLIDFGDLLIGQSKVLSIELVNKGYAPFRLPYINGASCSSDQFTLPSYIQSIAARSKTKIDITFKPTVAGSHTGNVTLTSTSGISHKFIVRGIAEEPAHITIDNDSFDIGDLDVKGENKEIKFVISNTGKYPLAYAFPKFTDQNSDIPITTSHKFGYSYITNLNGATDFKYDGNPELINPTNITSQFTDRNNWSEPISLGFNFPYYDKIYTEIYISNYGAVSISKNGAIHVCGVPMASPSCARDLGLISAYGIGAMKMNENSRIEYARQDGKFIIKFINTLAQNNKNSYIPISFHIILAANGDVEMHYDDYTPSKVSTGGEAIFVGMTDYDVLDPVFITDYESAEEKDVYKYFGTQSAVKFIAPGLSMVKNISSTSGMISIGESKEIALTVAAIQGMHAGALVNNLNIVSNDPINGVKSIKIKANIVGEDLKPIASLEQETVDFGTVFKTAIAKDVVTLKNSGTDKLIINDAKLEKGLFNFDQELPFIVEAGSSKDIAITMNTDKEGIIDDAIIFTTNNNDLHKATLKGKVIGVPQMQLNINEITETIPSGSKLNKQLTVTNTGNELLQFAIAPSNSYMLTNIMSDENSNMSYTYKASVDHKDVKHEWIDIETTGEGEHKSLMNFMYHDYFKVDLPYEITFYGKKYSKMYVYGVGFISFTEREDMHEIPSPPLSLPTTSTFYTNIIAPYWGVHFMSQHSKAGIYYAIRDESVIVSFMDYGNSLNIGVCFQAIIHKNGNIKYQYKLFEEHSVFRALYGVCGLQNEDGKQGIGLPERTIKEGEAIEFYPVRNTQLESGATKSINLNINTDMLAGEYDSDIIINTNMPLNNEIKLPLNLTITGQPQPIYPKKIEEESVVGVSGPNRVVEVYFEMANHGTAAYKIKNITAPGIVGHPTTWGTLQYYGYYSSAWGSNYQYMAYNPNTELTIGREPIKFRVLVKDYNTITNHEVPLIFTVEGLEQESIEIPFKISITPAPNITFDKPEVYIKGVFNDYKGHADVVISNTGEYKLKYALAIDATGSMINKTAENLEKAKQAMKQFAIDHQQELNASLVTSQSLYAITNEKDPNNLDLPSSFDYLRAMYYPMFPDNKRVYLIGAGNKEKKFIAGAHFTAPTNGFNLNNVYFYSTIGAVKNAEIVVEIVQGDDISSDNIIGRGKLLVPSEEPIKNPSTGEDFYNGKFRIITLDKPIYLNPNENFYVRFTFPAGHDVSLGLMPKEEAVVTKRYMHYVPAYGWIDTGVVYENQVGPAGFSITCLEIEEGGSWINILSQETSGIINPNENTTVKIGLNAAAARLEKNNKAYLVVTSNDPKLPVVSYPITLDKNSAPDFAIPNNEVYVKEGQESLITLEINDSDGDSYIVEINDENKIAKITSAITEVEGLKVELINDSLVKITSTMQQQAASIQLGLTFTPDYNQAGNYKLMLKATDVHNNVNETNMNFYVEHVNRAPLPISKDDIMLTINNTTDIIVFDTLFNDEDGDEMTYSMKLSAKDIVEAYTAPESVILVGKKLGKVLMTITAKDKEGAIATNIITVNVINNTGIDNATLKNAITVNPNPIVDFANITINTDINQPVSYRVYNPNATLMHSEVALVTCGQIHAIDMSNFASGMYYIEIEIGHQIVVLPVIKI